MSELRLLAATLLGAAATAAAGLALAAPAAGESWTAPGTAVYAEQDTFPFRVFASGGFAFNADGSRIVMSYQVHATTDNGFYVIDAATNGELWEVNTAASAFRGRPAVAPDGRIYVPKGAAGSPSTLGIFDPSTFPVPPAEISPAPAETVALPARAWDVAIVSDDVAYATLDNATIVRIERSGGVSAVAGTPIATDEDTAQSGLRLVYDPATQWLWHLSINGVRIYDTVAGAWRGPRVAPEGDGGSAEQLALDPVRERVVASWGTSPMRTRVFDSRSGDVLGTHQVGFGLAANSAAYDAATGTLYSTSFARRLLRESRLFGDPFRSIDHEPFGAGSANVPLAINPVSGLIYLPENIQNPVGQVVARTVSPTVVDDPRRVEIELAAGEPSRPVSFDAAATGVPVPEVQWQSRLDADGEWSDIAGATAATLELTASVADSGRYVRAVFTNSAGALASAPAKLVVTANPPKGSPPPGGNEPSERPSSWPAVSAPKRVAAIGPGGVAEVVIVSCRKGRACALKTPKRVRIAIAGKSYSARVLAPKRLAAGRKVRVRVVLPRAARKALVGRRASVRLKIVAIAGDRRTADTVVVTVAGRRLEGAV